MTLEELKRLNEYIYVFDMEIDYKRQRRAGITEDEAWEIIGLAESFLSEYLDAEIERQSVTDEGIAWAIAEVETWEDQANQLKELVPIPLMEDAMDKDIKLAPIILDALRAYKKPESPDKAIRRIIDERYKGLTKEERLANFERLKNRDRELEVSPEVWRAVAEDLGLIEPIEPEPCEW